MATPTPPARIAPALAALLRRPGWLHLAMLGVAMLLTMLIVMVAGDKLQQWDERIASFSWTLADLHAVERRVVIVDIDEKSIAAIGAWPWPRAKQAELLEKLDQAGVGLKMLDILFEGHSRDDARLARALASPIPTVQAQLFSLQPEPRVRSGQLLGAPGFLSAFAQAATGCPEASERAYGYMGSDIALPPGTPARAGHITPQVDPDGTIRRVPALVCYDGQAYPTLTLAGLLAANDGAVQPALHRGTGLLDPAWWLDMGALRLPLNETGQLRVSYQIPRTGFIAISAIDILQDKAPAELLRGAWVLVGATAFGARDAVPTPLGRAVSGVEVHAQLLSALLDERSPYAPRGAALWPWLAGLIGSLLLLAILRRNTFLQGSKNQQGNVLLLPIGAVLLILALQATSILLLLKAHLWLGWSIPGLYLLLAASLLGVAELARTRHERSMLYRNLASYLPEAVAREVALHEPSAQVRATRREATVLYADLRNFSAYCEGRPPEETAMVLHLFFTTASRVIEAHGGVLEQMVGDSLLATWNGSTPCENHNARALEAAVALWQACEPQLPRIDIASNKTPPLDLGIGIESGTVLIGSYGPAVRRTHAVLGETVTLATRLQALTAELAYPILIGPGVTITATAAHPNIIKLGEFLIDGFSTARTLRALPVERPTTHLQLVHDASRQVA